MSIFSMRNYSPESVVSDRRARANGERKEKISSENTRKYAFVLIKPHIAGRGRRNLSCLLHHSHT